MPEHRTQIKIIGEILDTTTNEIDEHEGTTITHIIRKANISHGTTFYNFEYFSFARSLGTSKFKKILPL